MISKWNRYLVTSLLGLAVAVAGCAARTGPIEGQARVEGDSTSASGRGQVTTESQTEQNKQKSSGQASGSASGSMSGSGSGSASGSASGSGSGSATGSGY